MHEVTDPNERVQAEDGGVTVIGQPAGLQNKWRCPANRASVEEIWGILQDDGHQALNEVALEGDGLVQGVAVGVVELLRGQGDKAFRQASFGIVRLDARKQGHVLVAVQGGEASLA